MRNFKPDTIVNFGKYRDDGFTVEELIQLDVEYVDWMMKTFDGDTWDDEIKHLVSRKLDR
jgi:hypothetical protein